MAFAMPGPTASFDERGGWVLARLMTDLAITQIQAAAIVGNLGGESGLQAINERHPTIPGSRGGFGWAQWTGPRRNAFEKWCQDQGLLPTDDAANYGFLCYELRGSQAHALEQLRKTNALGAAVYTFEYYFERPSNLQSSLPARVHYAQRAIAGLHQIPPPPGPTIPDSGVVAALRQFWDWLRKRF